MSLFFLDKQKAIEIKDAGIQEIASDRSGVPALITKLALEGTGQGG